MNSRFSPHFHSHMERIAEIIKNFAVAGTTLADGKRNKIKIFELEDIIVNVKAFKLPNTINKFVYRFLRKSKARRSFEFANILIKNDIGTPQPIAYFENYDILGLKDSYYISEHLNADLTYRELVEIPDYPDHENILRQFTRFSFKIHEEGIEFKDHSPGNTLIISRGNGIYDFYLVDLNRMEFHNTMSFEQRMENLKRLTPKKEMVAVMSNEYAKLYNMPEEKVFDKLWSLTSEFQAKFWRKKRIKKQLGIGK